MSSSYLKKTLPAYLKAGADCKGQNSFWPFRTDTASEAILKRRVLAEGVSTGVVKVFQELVYRFYAEHGRNLPWREDSDPYRVLVSEVMLQQTQVDRVIPLFSSFMQRFPDLRSLVDAPLPELLAVWQGLGYNRRALYLQRAAQQIVDLWSGIIPDDPLLLQQLPGIGPYTAGAIAAFAFNRPEVFLETNIRAVLLHLFFTDQQGVPDRELLAVAEQALDRRQPCNWYNALMDYGSDLKRRFPNPARRSRSHTVQSRFEGSDRQVRGAILRLLLQERRLSFARLQERLETDEDRLQRILERMLRDGLVQNRSKHYSLPQNA